MAFPGEAYIQARKYQLEQRATPSGRGDVFGALGEALATGAGTGVVKGEEQRQKTALEQMSEQRKLLREGILEVLKDGKWETFNPLTKEWMLSTLNEQIQAVSKITKGEQLPDTIRLVPKEKKADYDDRRVAVLEGWLQLSKDKLKAVKEEKLTELTEKTDKPDKPYKITDTPEMKDARAVAKHYRELSSKYPDWSPDERQLNDWNDALQLLGRDEVEMEEISAIQSFLSNFGFEPKRELMLKKKPISTAAGEQTQPSQYTEENIIYTLKKNKGLTRQQLLKRLNITENDIIKGK